jgi:uncharacterized flavoprotein (TIGR03862 family)
MKIAVIGGGPAGLRAAEVAAGAGAEVVVYDAKPSVGRKFLVAGKGGLNLTHSEPTEQFVTRYSGPGQPEDFWAQVIGGFDTNALRGWAARLDVGTFRASSGRVYPKSLKAAPLLRRWLARLRDELGVTFHHKHRLSGIHPGARVDLEFLVDGEVRRDSFDAVILALGGGSWPRTGSDGGWTEVLTRAGVEVAPLTAANCGWEVGWPAEVLAAAEGAALKNLTVTAAGHTAVGELIVTRYGIEGGPVYQLGAVLRGMDAPEVTIDFKPTFTIAQLERKMESARRDFLGEARVRWKLSEAACAILNHLHGPFATAAALAAAAKSCTVPLLGARPVEEAISSAGGVRWSELDESLMLRKLPGIFLAGEMIDWDAPTGGYLIHGCLATGDLAARSAVAWLTGELPCG